MTDTKKRLAPLERIRIVSRAQDMVFSILLTSETSIPQLTLADLGKPAALANALQKDIRALLDAMQEDRYYGGGGEVVIVPHYHGYNVIASDDSEIQLGGMFYTREEAEQYIKDNGLTLEQAAQEST